MLPQSEMPALPQEVLDLVISYASPETIPSLRLVSHAVNRTANKSFAQSLSASPSVRDIERCKGISHSIFAKNVKTFTWHDRIVFLSPAMPSNVFLKGVETLSTDQPIHPDLLSLDKFHLAVEEVKQWALWNVPRTVSMENFANIKQVTIDNQCGTNPNQSLFKLPCCTIWTEPRRWIPYSHNPGYYNVLNSLGGFSKVETLKVNSEVISWEAYSRQHSNIFAPLKNLNINLCHWDTTLHERPEIRDFRMSRFCSAQNLQFLSIGFHCHIQTEQGHYGSQKDHRTMEPNSFVPIFLARATFPRLRKLELRGCAIATVGVSRFMERHHPTLVSVRFERVMLTLSLAELIFELRCKNIVPSQRAIFENCREMVQVVSLINLPTSSSSEREKVEYIVQQRIDSCLDLHLWDQYCAELL